MECSPMIHLFFIKNKIVDVTILTYQTLQLVQIIKGVRITEERL